MNARVRIPDGMDGMNKTEMAWSNELEIGKRAGEIVHWGFETVKLRLAPSAWYTPDFFVVLPSGGIEIHETKGFMREAARVRLLTAASLYPWFVFKLVKKGKGKRGPRWVVDVI